MFDLLSSNTEKSNYTELSYLEYLQKLKGKRCWQGRSDRWTTNHRFKPWIIDSKLNIHEELNRWFWSWTCGRANKGSSATSSSFIRSLGYIFKLINNNEHEKIIFLPPIHHEFFVSRQSLMFTFGKYILPEATSFKTIWNNL